MSSKEIRGQLSTFLAEDIGTGDITGDLLPETKILGKIITKEPATVAGVQYAAEIFEMKGCMCRILKGDGTVADSNDVIMEVVGDARGMLACERTALNLLSRMSGIATQTRRLANMLSGRAGLYATRKTAPGLRVFDKHAVEIGGGNSHRLRLDDAIMIKDNHIAAAAAALKTSDIRTAIDYLIMKARKRYDTLEVEVESPTDALHAARAGATTIMLDNFTPEQISRTICLLVESALRDKVLLEASGNITVDNIVSYDAAGVDMISVGAITKSVIGIDVSLEVPHTEHS